MDNIKYLDRIEIIVKTDSPKTEITGVDNNIYRINVKAPAQNNKANIEILKFFSKLTKKDVKILKGVTNKRKTLRFIN